MRTTILFLAALWLSSTVLAQTDLERPANNYIDHLTLAINDFEAGIEALHGLTGVKPRNLGRDAALGTQSAVISLGPDTFLQIVAPDPKANPELIDPELKPRVLDRIQGLTDLTPFTWAIGTENMERTRLLLRRAGLRTADPVEGSLKKGWGRAMTWDRAWITRPDSRVTPQVVQWAKKGKRPQDRAPGACTLTELRVFSRNYKLLHALIAVTVLENAEPEGSDEDALQFTLDCDGEEVVFERASLMGLTASTATTTMQGQSR